MKHLLFFGTLLSLAVEPTTTEVTGARVTLVSKSNAVPKVTIENRRQSPMVECRVGLRSHEGKLQTESISNFNSSPSFGLTPIPQGGRAEVNFPTPPSNGDYKVVVTLAVFQDGFVEGLPAALERWQKAHRARVDELTYWALALDGMPRVSEPDLRRYLADRIAERSAAHAYPSPFASMVNPPRVLEDLKGILGRYRSGPEVWIPLDKLRDDAHRQLLEAVHRPAEGPAELANDPVQSVAVVSQRIQDSEDLIARIENLRRSPIEAYEVETFDLSTGRSQGGFGADYGSSPPDSPRRIRQGEPEDHWVSTLASGAKPGVRLRFVLYEDLSFEGDASVRDRYFKNREELAEDSAFTMGVLREALENRIVDVQPFLLKKRSERILALLADQRHTTTPGLDGVLLNLNLPRGTLTTNDILERQLSSLSASRDRLLRHKAR